MLHSFNMASAFFFYGIYGINFRVKIKFRVLHDIAISQVKLKIFISGNRGLKDTDHLLKTSIFISSSG